MLETHSLSVWWIVRAILSSIMITLTFYFPSFVYPPRGCSLAESLSSLLGKFRARPVHEVPLRLFQWLRNAGLTFDDGKLFLHETSLGESLSALRWGSQGKIFRFLLVT